MSLSADAPGSGDSDFASPVSASAAAGSATFSGLTLRNAADGYVVTASSTAGSTPPNSGLSNSFNVTASHLAVLTLANIRAGDVFTVTVEARDIDNNVAENFTGSVSLAVNVPAGGSGFAAAPASMSATAGTATFTNLQLLNAADGYTVSAASAGLTGDTSNTFNVTARTLVMGSIANVRAGDSFNVQVQALDAQAVPQLAENFNAAVTLAANVPAGGSGFATGSPQNASAGIVTFGRELLNAADGYTLTASSGALNSSTSNAFNVTARALVVNPLANVRAGDPFSVTVTAVDAQATPQTAENYDGTVSLAVNVPAGGSGFAAAPGPWARRPGRRPSRTCSF